jgi:cyclic pyranopterin phosphate synthase
VPLLDRFQRPLQSLRVSLTDRCNLRCRYCMPEEKYVWLPKSDVLRFDEVATLVEVFLDLGVEKIRLTGGEPLLRSDVVELVRMLGDKARIRDLSLTTNGVLLADLASDLARAGVHRITVSLDTMRADRFRTVTGRDEHAAVLRGIRAASAVGIRALKIDAVLIRGTNDDEIGDLLAFGKDLGAEVRFIEYMDVGGATRWSATQVMSRDAILAAVSARHGDVLSVGARGSAPAERFELADGTVFGVIGSTTAPFCRACDRGRLTADGLWLQCLYASRGLDLRGLLRSGATPADISRAIAEAWSARTDRGAETRLDARDRGPVVPVEALRREPHLEMHTRGG